MKKQINQIINAKCVHSIPVIPLERIRSKTFLVEIEGKCDNLDVYNKVKHKEAVYNPQGAVFASNPDTNTLAFLEFSRSISTYSSTYFKYMTPQTFLRFERVFNKTRILRSLANNYQNYQGFGKYEGNLETVLHSLKSQSVKKTTKIN